MIYGLNEGERPYKERMGRDKAGFMELLPFELAHEESLFL